MQGISLISNITRKNDADFYLVDQDDILGGCHQALTYDDMLAISETRLKEGTLCLVVQPTPTIYIYSTDNKTWSEFSIGSSSVSNDLWTYTTDNQTIAFDVDVQTYTKVIKAINNIKTYTNYQYLPSVDDATSDQIAYCISDVTTDSGVHNKGLYWFNDNTKLWTELYNFISKDELNTHIQSTDVHVTSEERELWNNKSDYIPTNKTALDKIGEDENGNLIYNNQPISGLGDCYDKTTIDELLESKSDSSHTHNELHTHTNRDSLDKISENENGEFLFNGNKISGTVDLSDYYTSIETDSLLLDKAEVSHSHDEFANIHVHNNHSTIDKLSESDDGFLLFNGKKIEGESTSNDVVISNINDELVSSETTWSSAKIQTKIDNIDVHDHSNKGILDRLSEGNGTLLFDGKAFVSNTYSIASYEVYSDDERVIGCYKNGKPVYSRCIEGTTSDTELTWKSVFSNKSNIEEYVSIQLYIKNKEGFIWAIPFLRYYDDHSRVQTAVYNVGLGKSISVLCHGEYYLNCTVYGVVKYIKTTDAENSFTPDMIYDNEDITQEQIHLAALTDANWDTEV